MEMRIFARFLQGADRWIADQTVALEDGCIRSVAPGVRGDLSCAYLTLGPLDEHHHGALGFDAAAPDMDKAREWLLFLAKSGVANILYTVGTGDVETTRGALDFAKRLMRLQARGEAPGARVLGVHLEGPFISPARFGAMNKDRIQVPSAESYLRLTEGYRDIVRLVTLAPEVEGALSVAEAAQVHGARAQAGHTDATGEEARRGFAAGIDGVTHTFNACRPIHQREGGVLTAALLDRGVYCEAICDLVHVDPELLKLLIKVKGPERVLLVSDSVATAGLPDGRYYFGNHPVIVRDGRNYTESGGIAGSAKQQSDGIRNLIALGVPSHDVLAMATAAPLRRFGQSAVLRPGAEATLVGWDESFHPLFTILRGARVC